MNKAEEMRKLSSEACRASDITGWIFDDIEAAAREGRYSVEISVPSDYEERRSIWTALETQGFTLSGYNEYINKVTVSW